MNVNRFLKCETPQSWLDQVDSLLPTLLIDHANCEKKAASTALNLMYRYADKPDMMQRLSKLAREELRHFEQVLSIMRKRDIEYEHISASRYAGGLRDGVRKQEPGRLLDILLVSTIIEARSCERFEKLVPVLDNELADFYASLLKSEARHASLYWDLAQEYAVESIDERLDFLMDTECQLIASDDDDFRFHSGVPICQTT